MVPLIGSLGIGNEILVIDNEDRVGTSRRLLCFIFVLPTHILVSGPHDVISSVCIWVACSGSYVQRPADDVRTSCIYVPARNNYRGFIDN